MKHTLKCFAAGLFIFACMLKVNAAVVDTVDTYSPSMKKTIKAVVITPNNYAALIKCDCIKFFRNNRHILRTDMF